jgi:hypothetical protein
MYEFSGMSLSLRFEFLRSKAVRSILLNKAVLYPLLILAGAGSALAADPVISDDDSAIFDELTTQLSFSSPLEAYRQGKAAYDEGWYGLALPAIRFAAKRGVFGARLMLAKMYELGLGLPRDPAAAFDLYKNISERNWNISNFHPAAPYIGQALASLGIYYLNGIDEIDLKPNAKRAATYFTHAAQYFGNPTAQYQLAKLYLSGQGVKKNSRRAIGWLNNATKKKHAPSQALLGQLLWEGELAGKQQIRALALLTMARENAGPQDSEWINGLYKTIVAAADLKTRKGAKTAVARWARIYQPRVKIKRVIIRKQVRIGVTKNGQRVVQSKQIVKRQVVPNSKYQAGGRLVRAKPESDQTSSDERQWMGLGSFREIDLK